MKIQLIALSLVLVHRIKKKTKYDLSEKKGESLLGLIPAGHTSASTSGKAISRIFIVKLPDLNM